MTQPLPHDPRPEDHPRKRVNLALQGGGSHGAFSWGVLDALLEDGRIEPEAISGTSAGAMNAVVLASGYARGGAEGARADLAEFWRRLGALGRTSPFRRSWWSRLTGKWRIDDTPSYALASIGNLFLSPYQTNPYGLNPLRGLLKDVVDFDAVRRDGGIRLFLSATDVETGKNRLFRTPEVCVEAVLASACLPQLFQAVKYQGRHYWDGGYMGNPALWPLFYESGSRDVVLVAINPLNRPGVPMTPFEIMDRVNEITFNSSLMREMRAVQFVTRLIETGRLDAREYKHVLMHRVSGDKELADLHASSKLNAEPDFLEHLFTLGRRAGQDWLARHFDDVGQRTSIDIVNDYF
ncbi:patatin-like phospholipase family protein [Aerophototrophica crusticola]|uniref:Patatin-like phospholipase family protein n=1 Tax=Aerophototrophica crusticola TaxID=1709002 RepID=A0A858RAI5_9PROT|nr:patatin-like phospholipase family protein [Rhodospirillaceae bacterium B3]